MEPTSHVTYLDDDELDSIITAVAQVVDAKSHFTYGHSERVAQYSDLLTTQLAVMPSVWKPVSSLLAIFSMP